MSPIPLASNIESSVPMILSTATCIFPTAGTAPVPRLRPFVHWVKEDGVDVSISAVEIGKLIADAAVSSPFVGMAAGILANILKLISKDKGNREVELRIVQRCAKFISTVSAHFGAGNITLLPSFEQFEADLRNIQLHITSNPKTHLARLKRLISADNYATQLQDLQIRVEDAMRLFQTITLMSIHSAQHNRSSGLQNQNTSCEAHVSNTCEEDTMVIKHDDIILEHQIHVGRGVRVHSARVYGGRFAIVKVFEGGQRQENFRKAIELGKDLWHPNILSLDGHSCSTTRGPFTVHHTNARGCAIRYIAKAVSSGGDHIFTVGATLVADLAAGLDYLYDHNISIPPISIENYFIFMDDRKAVLSFSTQEMLNSEQASPINSSDKGLTMLGELCSQTFNSANEILYSDYSALADNVTEMEPSGVIVERESVRTDGDQNHVNLRNSREMPDAPPVSPRREIKWQMSSYSAITLKLLLQEYQKMLISSTPFEHARRSTSNHRILHRCRGYRREEVTFGASVMGCKVITSTTPLLHELCSVCGENVEEGLFNCYCGQPDDGVSVTFQCVKCSVWGHGKCKRMDKSCWRCYHRSKLLACKLSRRTIASH